jgi:hypothetical protein
VSKFSNSPLVQVAGGLYFCYVSDRYQITQILKKNQTDVNRTSKIQKKPSIQDPKGESRKTKSITISKKDQVSNYPVERPRKNQCSEERPSDSISLT